MKSLISLFLLLKFNAAWASPCCAGSASLPSLVTTDDRAQIGTSITAEQTIGDAPTQKSDDIAVFRAESNRERSQVFKVQAGTLISDRLQVGASVPFVRRSKSLAPIPSSTGLGDVQATFAYEVLPEWSYSVWRPKGFLFSATTFPTGKSVFETTTPFGIDTTGRGVLVSGFGVALLKNWSDFDALLVFEGHHAFNRTLFLDGGSQTVLIPGNGGYAVLGGGWSPWFAQKLARPRLGISISPVFEEGFRTWNNSERNLQLVWNTNFQFSLLPSAAWMFLVSYNDQTLLGPAYNVQLNRSFALMVQRRWER